MGISVHFSKKVLVVSGFFRTFMVSNGVRGSEEPTWLYPIFKKKSRVSLAPCIVNAAAGRSLSLQSVSSH